MSRSLNISISFQLIPRLCFFICLSLAYPLYGQVKYDLNDPRNPDCPCHKYQKLADDEFAALNKQKQDISDPLSRKIIDSDSSSFAGSNNAGNVIAGGNIAAHTSRKSGQKFYFRAGRWKFTGRRKGIKRKKAHYQHCPRW